jgi:geranylgeranyl diphosphate synthase type II
MILCHEILAKRIEERLKELVPNKEGNSLFAAARYSLFAPSKRLRPFFVLRIAECYGVDIETALNPACALEIVHTYSLIHDDLPCMDNDDERRGKPSLHKAFPEGHAMLTGDFLLTYAFEILASSPDLTPEQRIALIQTLSRSSGEEGMAGGQASDLEWQRSGYQPDWQEFAIMLSKKTAALFACAFEMGGIIANASQNDLVSLRDAGLAYGLAFQIQDDIADEDGCLPLLGHEAASALASQLFESSKSSLPPPCVTLFTNQL